MTDFRVDTDYRRHPKIVKLESQYGADGVLALLELWAFAGRYRPKGILTKMNPQDIAIAAKWRGGDPTQFVTFLVDVRLLDKRGRGQYSIHDWKEHNGYLFYKPERRKKALTAAKQKHTFNANELRPAKSGIEQPECPAPVPTPVPVPTPSPTPVPVVLETLREEMQYQHGGFFQGYLRKPDWRTALSDLLEHFPLDQVKSSLVSMPEYYQKNGVPVPADDKIRAKLWQWTEREGAKQTKSKIDIAAEKAKRRLFGDKG